MYFKQMTITIQDIKDLLDQFQKNSMHELLDTVCMIDECNRIDKMLEEALRAENIDLGMDEEIDKMIMEDIRYWDEVYAELDNYECDYDDYYV